MNRKAFFDHVRESLFRGALTKGQVAGLDALLDEWAETGFTNRQWLAYCLATAYHETARTMQPIREYGRGRGHKYGEKDKQTGHAYYGRGYVQLTWRDNYARAGRYLGQDFERNPDAVMEPGTAAIILYVGMEQGWFTGKRLDDYINDRQRDYWNARRIVNGTDKAGAIADYALKFEAALDAADYVPEPIKPDYAPDRIKPDYTPDRIEDTEQHWLVRLIKWIFGK